MAWSSAVLVSGFLGFGLGDPRRTILGSAPASRVARYPASFRSHSAILRAVSSSSLVSVAAWRSGDRRQVVNRLIQTVRRELAGDPPVHLADDRVFA